MRRWSGGYTSTLVLNQPPTSTGQRRSCSASQRTLSKIKKPASTATNQHQYRVATTRSQRPPSRPLARRTEHQLVNDDKAEDPSGGDSDDHHRRHPQINSNRHQRLSRTRQHHCQAQPDRSHCLARSHSPHQRRNCATHSSASAASPCPATPRVMSTCSVTVADGLPHLDHRS